MSCYKLNDFAINQVTFSPHADNQLLSAYDDNQVILFDIKASKLVTSFSNHRGSVRGVSFSPLNNYLLCSVGLDKNLILYDSNDKNVINKITCSFPL